MPTDVTAFVPSPAAAIEHEMGSKANDSQSSEIAMTAIQDTQMIKLHVTAAALNLKQLGVCTSSA